MVVICTRLPRVLGTWQMTVLEWYRRIQRHSCKPSFPAPVHTYEASTVRGQYYRVDWAMPSRVEVVLRTMWEIAPGEEIPRLVSVFIR